MNMETRLRRIVTPDMVSLWLPSGTERAMDIIRGNDGQCYGTHPNILAGTNLIDPSLGWSFDAIDDYINFGNRASLKGMTEFTVGCWVHCIGTTGASQSVASAYLGADDYFRIIMNTTPAVSGFFKAGGTYVDGPIVTVSYDAWHCVTYTYDGLDYRLYLNNADEGIGASSDSATAMPNADFEVGRYQAGNFQGFNGFIALPFVANAGWSAAQVSNFYLATKGFFSPRG